MINILIIIIIAIAIAGGGTFAVVSFLTASQGASDSYLNLIRFEQTASSIQSNFSYSNGAVRAPSGTNGADYMQVPGWVTHNARTVGGVPFEYCPYSILSYSTGTTGGTVEYPNSASNYAIQTFSSASTGNRAYVMDSGASVPAAAPAGTLALLVMPASSRTTMPSCADVAMTSGTLTVAGGVVLPITADPLPTRFVPGAPAAINLYVAPAASGTGSGRDAANPMTLDDAMQLWRDLQPRATVINLAAAGSGTPYAVTDTTLASTGLPAANTSGLRLVFRGGDVANTVLSKSTSTEVSLPANWFWENLTFNNSAANLYVPVNASLNTNNVTLLFSQIKNSGKVNIFGATTMALPSNISMNSQLNIYAPLTLSSGSMSIYYNGSLNIVSSSVAITNGGFFARGGATIRIADSTLSNSDCNGSDAGSYLYSARLELVKASTISLKCSGAHSTIIMIGGEMYLDASYLRSVASADNALNMVGGGARFAMTNSSEIGSNTIRPAKGISAGGYKIAGDSTYLGTQSTVYGTSSCWSDSLVARSNEGNGTVSSAVKTGVNYDYLQTKNQSNFACVR